MTRPLEPLRRAARSAGARLAAGLTALSFASAALAQAAAQAGMPPPPKVQSAGGIEFVNGGVGEEARAVIAAMQSNFSLRLIFSDPIGAYVVVDRVRVRQGPGEVFSVDGAGPMLLIKLLPGDYTVEATHGGKVERRQVQLGRQPVTLNWRVPRENAASAPR
jgi:hypothetical protein